MWTFSRRRSAFVVTCACLTVWLGALASLLHPGRPVAAQYGLYTSRSLEWQTANSSVIARGVVVDVEPERTQAEGWRVATLSVAETLKGSPRARLTLAFFAGRQNDVLQRWQASGEERLWFLRTIGAEPRETADTGLERPVPELLSRQHGIQLYAPNYLWSAVRIDPDAKPDAAEPPPPFMNLELRPLSARADILQAVRQAIAYGQTRPMPRLHRLGVPHSVAAQAGRVGDINEILVPIDGRLEKLARRLIESPAATGAEQDMLRASGVRAIRHFRSRRNIELLKGLLRDPATLVVTGAPQEQIATGAAARSGQRIYYIRHAAYDVLQQWGVRVKKPVLQAVP